MTLNIYRVRWTYPARNPFTDLNILKMLIIVGLLLDRSDRSDPLVRPVGPCRTGHSTSTGHTARSDRSDRLVPILAVSTLSAGPNSEKHRKIHVNLAYGPVSEIMSVMHVMKCNFHDKTRKFKCIDYQ